jgi:HEAT repeat protein
LRDPHFASSRPSYALALLKIDRPAAKVAVPALIEVLDRKRHTVYLADTVASAVRKQAASVLGQMGGDARQAIPALANALEDADAGVRQEAAKALGAIGVPARQAVPSLQKALTDPDAAVRSEAALALQKIGA